MDAAPSKSDETLQWVTGILCLVALLIFVFLGFTPRSSRPSHESAAMQTTRSLELAMFSYAQDHDGNYPTGRSSTEVFQKLINDNYLSAPEICYLRMPEKTAATSTNLVPQNVAYDVTVPMTEKTPDDVPGVFATGYLVEYIPDGRAIRLRTDHPDVCDDGLPIAYHSNSAFYRATRDSTGTITNVIPASASLGTNIYTQITPDGPVPAP